MASTDQHDTIRIEYQEAFYGNEIDVPKIGRSYGGREFKLKSKKVSNLPEFDLTEGSTSVRRPEELWGQVKPDFKFWQIAVPPPRRKEVVKWLEEQRKDKDMGVQNADPGELDQFSQVGLKHTVEMIVILRVWYSLMVRLRRINMGGSILRNRSLVMSGRNYNP